MELKAAEQRSFDGSILVARVSQGQSDHNDEHDADDDDNVDDHDADNDDVDGDSGCQGKKIMKLSSAGWFLDN